MGKVMQNIFITGANRGIGFAIVEAYLASSYVHIFATCRQPDKAIALNKLREQYSDSLTIVPLEVTSQESIDSALDLVQSKIDSLDILINNAGVDNGNQSLETITPEMMIETYSINTIAPLMISKAFLPLLKDGAKLIHTSSSMASLANRTYGGNYAYCSSKAALNMMMRGLASDLRSSGIITIALDPGWVRTDMGGQSASLSPQQSSDGVISVIDNLTKQDNGRYLVYDGSEHPW